MKSQIKIRCCFLYIFCFFSFQNYAQFGGLKDIKNKVPKTTQEKKISDEKPDNQSKAAKPSVSEKSSETKNNQLGEYKKYFESKHWSYNKLNNHGDYISFKTLKQAEDYLSEAKKFNREEFFEKLQKAKAIDPTIENDYYVKMGYDFLKKYPEFANSIIQKEINSLINDAYKWKTNQPQKAVEYSEMALDLSEAVLLILPQDAGFTKLREKAEKTNGDIGKEVYAKLYTSDFHKKHTQQIVFSDKPLKIKQENELSIKNSFTSYDKIYAIAYFKDKIKNVLPNPYILKVFSDENLIKFNEVHITDAEMEQTYLELEIVPDPATSKVREAMIIVSALEGIAPVKHKIKIGFDSGAGDYTKIGGEFSLDMSANGPEQYETLSDKLKVMKYENMRMPNPNMKDAKIEQDFIALCKTKGFNPLRAVIVDYDWNINRNAFDEITHRTLKAMVAFKNSENKCVIQPVYIRQDYSGGKYGKSVYDGASAVTYDIKCENVNK